MRVLSIKSVRVAGLCLLLSVVMLTAALTSPVQACTKSMTHDEASDVPQPPKEGNEDGLS